MEDLSHVQMSLRNPVCPDSLTSVVISGVCVCVTIVHGPEVHSTMGFKLGSSGQQLRPHK